VNGGCPKTRKKKTTKKKRGWSKERDWGERKKKQNGGEEFCLDLFHDGERKGKNKVKVVVAWGGGTFHQKGGEGGRGCGERSTQVSHLISGTEKKKKRGAAGNIGK